MKRAVGRVFQALERAEVITIHGDYDADGTCRTTVLVPAAGGLRALRSVHCEEYAEAASEAWRDQAISSFDETKITTYIPHREKEGYGMSIETIEHLNEHENTELVITVDCGISNKPAIDRGATLRIDTIVCDHHTMPAQLPTSADSHPPVGARRNVSQQASVRNGRGVQAGERSYCRGQGSKSWRGIS